MTLQATTNTITTTWHTQTAIEDKLYSGLLSPTTTNRLNVTEHCVHKATTTIACSLQALVKLGVGNEAITNILLVTIHNVHI